MNTLKIKKIVAKEWIYALSSFFFIVIVVASVVIVSHKSWAIIFNEAVIILAIFLYILVLLVRFTLWSIKTIKK
jgi:hypothetical protein